MASEGMNEVVTRGILKEELQELKVELQEELQKLENRLLAEDATREDRQARALVQMAETLRAEMRELRAEMKAEMTHVARYILEQMEILLRLRLEPLSDVPPRVAALEAAELPARVERLEAKVFPPKRPARRRRG